MGVPFVGVRGLLGTDILKNRPDLKVIPNAFRPEEKVVVVPPIRPDVAVFHALKADRWGNAITPGLRDDLMMARAASRVVVTAEEITEKELTSGDGVENTFLPAIDVDVIVHLPWGAHPCACGTLYNLDEAHLREYIEAAQEENKFKNYLQEYIGDARNHQEYLQRVGVIKPLPEEKAHV
jgi:hypothetical protein